MEPWHHLVEHIGFLGVVARTPLATRAMEASIIAIISAIATSTLTANTVSARLEERIASLASRIEACEANLHEHQMEDLRVRERIATCEAKVAEHK